MRRLFVAADVVLLAGLALRGGDAPPVELGRVEWLRDFAEVAAKGGKLDTDTQQQYHLAQDPKHHVLPLTALQATKVNAAMANGERPDRWLTPSQRALRDRLARDEALLARLRRLRPNRSAEGVAAYAAEVDAAARGR